MPKSLPAGAISSFENLTTPMPQHLLQVAAAAVYAVPTHPFVSERHFKLNAKLIL